MTAHAKLTLYSGDLPVSEAIARARGLLTGAQPRAVELHTWRPDLYAPEVRKIIPDVELSVGIGVDSEARDVAQGRQSVAAAVAELLRVVVRADAIGATSVTWNAEAAWKKPPNSTEALRVHQLVRALLGEVQTRYPHLRQEHTAYDHPTHHSAYPWPSWLGAGSPVLASYAQVYAAPGGGLKAHRGALEAREARALASWSAAVRAGWIRPDAPEGTAGDLDDVDWHPYYQLHHVPAVDTAASALEHGRCALWAAPTRMDADGREAASVLAAIDRADLWDVRALQAAVGVEVDGRYGPVTHGAVVRWAASRQGPTPR